jgi:hypothetical protein
MEEVERVEGHAEEADERVVPARHEEERDHVDHGKVSGPVPDELGNVVERPGEVDGHDAKGHIGREVAEQEDELHAGGQRAGVDGRAELELAVVALAEDGRVLDIPLEPRVRLAGDREIPLRVVVEACDGPDIPDQDGRDPPDEQDDGNDAQHEEQIMREHLVDDFMLHTGL